MTKDNENHEETEPEVFTDRDNSQVDDAGVPGQIVYPDADVDAEHAAAYAAGKEDTLYPDEDDPRNEGWQNPADRPDEEQKDDDEDSPTTRAKASKSSASKSSSKK